MPAIKAYVNPRGGRRHAFPDCPHLRPGYREMTIDSAGLDCKACRKRLAELKNEAKGATA